jgi:hypothetical protein
MHAKNRAFIGALSVAALVVGASVGHAAESKVVTVQAQQLRQDMRKLWSDHAIWTREYIVAAVDGSPDASAAAARLLRNQEDIGGAVAGVYGREAGDKLTALLKQHILIAVDLVAAAKEGDTAKYGAADTQWNQNAVDIADFLSSANPNWPKATLTTMMHTHLATTRKEVVARLNKQWDEDVKAFDEVYTHMLHMADALAEGIISQFPQRF